MNIQIHPGHIGGAARKKDAKRLVKALQALNWPTKLVTGDIEALWSFDSFTDLHDFELDFERVKDRFWPAYEWRELFPCEECGCTCKSKLEGATTLKTFIDYDPNL